MIRRLWNRWVGCTTCRTRFEHRRHVRAVENLNQMWEQR